MSIGNIFGFEAAHYLALYASFAMPAVDLNKMKTDIIAFLENGVSKSYIWSPENVFVRLHHFFALDCANNYLNIFFI